MEKQNKAIKKTNQNQKKKETNINTENTVEPHRKSADQTLTWSLYQKQSQIYVELEEAVLTSNSRVRVPIGADGNVFPSFSGSGCVIFPPYKVLFCYVLQIVFVLWSTARSVANNRMTCACNSLVKSSAMTYRFQFLILPFCRISYYLPAGLGES